MSWFDDMKTDAARVAFGDRLLWEDDEIEFSVDYNPGCNYSSYTYEDPELELTVAIRSRNLFYRTYNTTDTQEFLTRLMDLGSQRTGETA